MTVRRLAASAALFLAACGEPADPTATAATEAAGVAPGAPAAAAAPASPPASASASLPDRLDCLREAGGVLIVGHRGGPTRDYPENAIETLQRTYDAGTHAMEIDVRLTKDGQLVLMHDEDLERTTTGEGLVADHTLAEIQQFFLETYSTTTAFRAPTLEAALAWAVKSGALLKIDKKRETPYAPILAAIRAAGAENNAIVITYTDAQAVEVHTSAPDLVITASLENTSELDALISRGVKPERVVAWTSTGTPKPELWQALAARGVESSFGTLGPRSTSLDTRYWEDGDGSEYNQLVADGLSILDTDITDKAARQLRTFTAKAAPCGL